MWAIRAPAQAQRGHGSPEACPGMFLACSVGSALGAALPGKMKDKFCIYPQESRAFRLSVVDKSERWLPSPWGLEKFSRPPGPRRKPCLTKSHQDSSCPDEGEGNAGWWL